MTNDTTTNHGQSAEETDGSSGIDDGRTTDARIGPPPIMKTWPRLYALVLTVLAFDIIIFYLVTRIFS